METVEVLVRIPKDKFEMLTQAISVPNEYNIIRLFKKVLKNGTVLPKGHGDLVDKDELLKDTCTAELWDGREEEVIWESTIKLAPTVIEADKGEQDGR